MTLRRFQPDMRLRSLLANGRFPHLGTARGMGCKQQFPQMSEPQVYDLSPPDGRRHAAIACSSFSQYADIFFEVDYNETGR